MVKEADEKGYVGEKKAALEEAPKEAGQKWLYNESTDYNRALEESTQAEIWGPGEKAVGAKGFIEAQNAVAVPQLYFFIIEIFTRR